MSGSSEAWSRRVASSAARSFSVGDISAAFGYDVSLLERFARFERRKQKNAIARTKIAAKAQPTPIPAFAPLLRPDELELGSVPEIGPPVDDGGEGELPGAEVAPTNEGTVPEAAPSNRAGVEIAVEGAGMPLVNGNSPLASGEPLN